MFNEAHVMDVQVYKNTQDVTIIKHYLYFITQDVYHFLSKYLSTLNCATFHINFSYKATRGQHQRQRHQWT